MSGGPAHAGRGSALLSLVMLLATGLATPIWAQRPHGVPPGLLKRGQNAGGSTLPARPEGTRTGAPAVRSFGVWLDDATALEPGDAWLAVSAQRWSSGSLHGFDVPIAGVVVGLTPRLQASATLPFTQYAAPGSPMDGQVGDLYMGAKYVLRNPAPRRMGLSVSPNIELLSRAARVETGLSRVHAVLPLNVEWQFDGSRAYASTGYHTRGAIFVAGAFEHALSAHTRADAALTYSQSIAPVEASTTWGLSRRRVDASAGFSWIVSDRLVVFGGLSRTVSRMDPDSTRYAVTFGTSMAVGRSGSGARPRGAGRGDEVMTQ